MNRLVKRLYIFLAIVLITTLVGIQLQLDKSERFIKEEVEKELYLSSIMMHEEVNEWIKKTNIIIQEVSRSLTYTIVDDDILETYLISVGKTYSDFLAVYYGGVDGTFLISNGWDVPPTFDHTVRPWYVDALKAKKSIVTDPFIDAMTGELIVTFARPVWNQTGDIVGIVGGDMTLSTLTTKFDDYSNLSSSEFVLIDKFASGENKVLSFSEETNDFETFYGWYKEFNVAQGKNQGLYEVNKNGVDGFFHYHHINSTDWILMNFSPIDTFTETITEIEMLSFFVYIILIIFVIIVYYGQKKYITQPLLNFGDHMSRINILTNPGYRLPKKDHVLFGPIIKKINRVLDRVEDYLREIENDQNEMHAMNEELEASLEQIIATEQEARRQKLNFEALFINNQNAVAMMDQDHKVRNVNEAFTQLFGYELQEIEGLNLDDVISNNNESRLEASEYTLRMFDGQLIDVEGTRYTKENEPVEVKIQGVPMTHHGYMVGAFGIYTNIGTAKAEERYRHYLSTHDDLTGLYNRAYFNRKILEEQQLGTYPLTIMIVDVNGLKLINDAFGIKIGDELLVETAKAISALSNQLSSESCLLARYGGDEFIILVKNKTKDEIAHISKEIKAVCHQIKLNDVEVSVSVGWSQKFSSKEDIIAVLRLAEDDLYKHKIMEGSSIKGKTIYTIINTLHETNKREEEHSRRVSVLSEKFGEALNLSEREMTALKSMSLLHDVGKIAIDEKILNKPSALTNSEYNELKRHPEIGYRILSSVVEMSEIAEYVLSHHERWDGKGYPRGLVGEEIPYLARVISIVDAFDAMTSNRPYRDAQDIKWALDELQKNSGSQFDPELVPVFIKVSGDSYK